MFIDFPWFFVSLPEGINQLSRGLGDSNGHRCHPAGFTTDLRARRARRHCLCLWGVAAAPGDGDAGRVTWKALVGGLKKIFNIFNSRPT